MKNGNWHFPLIDPANSHPIAHYLLHISEEIREFSVERDKKKRLEEAMDILHSAETFVRKYFQQENGTFRRTRDKIIAKNRERGYYG